MKKKIISSALSRLAGSFSHFSPLAANLANSPLAGAASVGVVSNNFPNKRGEANNLALFSFIKKSAGKFALPLSQRGKSETLLAGCPAVSVGRVAYALLLLAFLASGAMAATINVGTETDPITVRDGDIVTGTAMGKRLNISAGANVTFRNLTLTGDMYYAALVNTGNAVTINLVGSNKLTGGIGGAGLRVPRGASVIINGPGSLDAQGGQWRSLIQADAGAGIGGGNVSATGATNAGNYGDSCGTVTINGGTITARGGASGESGTNNNARYTYGAGIGGSGRAGSGCTLTINGGNITAVGGREGYNDIGPGLGYANANFGTETRGNLKVTKINGGSVKGNIYASGANYSLSVELMGTGGTAPFTDATCNGNIPRQTFDLNNSNTNITANANRTTYYVCDRGNNNNCNAGSFTYQNAASVAIGSVPRYTCFRVTTASVSNSNTTAQTLTLRTFTLGQSSNIETTDVAVNACRFGNISCQTSLPGNNGYTNGYGINDVKTDYDRKVYFWLPSNSGVNLADSIKLNLDGGKDYKPTATTVTPTANNYYNFQGPAPSMIIPAPAPNSFVCGEAAVLNPNNVECDAVGPYGTGFRMASAQYVAAVNHEITMYKGRYVQNDAGEEAAGTSTSSPRIHEVKWYRSLNENRSGATEISGSAGFLSSAVGTLTYTPVAEDYGKYIWAEIIVRDNTTGTAGRSSAPIQYPVIKVGVVIMTSAIKDESLEVSDANFSATTGFLQMGVTPEKGLITTFEPTVWRTISALAQLDGIYDGVVGYDWEAYLVKVNDNGTIVSLPDADPLFPYVGSFKDKEDKDQQKGSGSPASFILPMPGSTQAGYIGGDIMLKAKLKDGSTPQLKSITITARDNPDNTHTYSVNEVTNTLTENLPVIPKAGTITLTFALPLRDTYPTDAAVHFQFSGTDKGSGSVSRGGTQEVTYTYSLLDSGTTYNFVVENFVNKSGTPMSRFTANMRVERRPYISWSGWNGYNNSGAIIAGQSNVTKTFEYANDHDGGAITGMDCYWEVADGVALGNDAGGAAPTAVDNTFNGTESGQTSATCNASTTSLIYTPAVDDFGKWVRLVIRPVGTTAVDGTSLNGDARFTEWKRIGYLLQAGTPEKETRTCEGTIADGNCEGTFSYSYKDSALIANNISFAGCNGTNLDPSMPDCITGGLIVYYNRYIGLSAEPSNNDYVVVDWMDRTREPDGKEKGCNLPGNTFNCSSIGNNIVSYSTIAGAGTNGIVTIHPVLGKIDIPAIRLAEVTKVNGVGTQTITTERINMADVFTDIPSIAVLNNELVIGFDLPMDTALGKVTLSRGTNQELVLDKEWDTDNMTVRYNLSEALSNEIFKSGGSVFGSSFSINVSGFMTPGKARANTGYYSIVTVDGPSVERLVLTQDGTGSSNDDELSGFVVGTQITSDYGNYVQNGGLAAGTGANGHQYCLQIVDNTTDRVECTTARTTTSTFTPAGAEFGKYVRLIIIPRDVEGNEGKMVASAWKRVGVRLIMGTISKGQPGDGANTAEDYGDVIGTPVGTIEAYPQAESSAGVIVFGRTSVHISSERSTDKISGAWQVTGSGTVSPAADKNTYWNPGTCSGGDCSLAPSGNVTLSARIVDGSKPVIGASYVASSSALNFNVTNIVNEPKRVQTTNQNAHLIIKALSGNATQTQGQEWTCTVGTGIGNFSQQTYTSGTTEVPISVPLSCFTGFTVDGSTMYEVRASAGAFRDRNDNYNDEQVVLSFGSGLYYGIKPGEYFFTQRGDYGTAIGARNVNITNIGNTTVGYTITKSGANADMFNISNNCLTNVSASSTCQIRITTASEILNAGTYEAVLKIESRSDGNVLRSTEEISFTYIVAPIALDNPVNSSSSGATFVGATPTVNASKEYDGTTASPEINSWTWNGAGKNTACTSCDNITVTAAKGEFTDANVGYDKPVTIKYTINNVTCQTQDGAEICNYVFKSTGTKVYNANHQADITQKKIHIVVNGGNLGSKQYDGIASLPGESLTRDKYTVYNDNGGSQGTTVITNADILLSGGSINFLFDGNDPNVGEHNITDVGGARLGGNTALNYDLIKITVTSGSKGTVIKRSLSGLNPTLAATFSGNNNGTPSYVKGVATYGDQLTASSHDNWKLRSDGRVELYGSVYGNWRVCGTYTDDKKPGNCPTSIDPAVPGSPVGTPSVPATDVYAYYLVDEPANYENNLVVRITFDSVAHKPIVIATDGNTAKTYDGKSELCGVIASTENTKDQLVGNDNLESVEEDGCAISTNKNYGVWPLTVKWKLDANTALKYTAEPTKTMVSIGRRNVSVVGGFKVADKEYDGTNAVTGVTVEGTATLTKASELTEPDKGLIAEDVLKVGANLVGACSNGDFCGAKFQSKNVDWNSNSNQAEPITVTFKPNTFALIAIGSGTATDVNNYYLESVESEATIKQAKLNTVANIAYAALHLKNEVTYGNDIRSAYIERAVEPTGLQFPQVLGGVNSEEVQGNWQWANPSQVIDNNATATLSITDPNLGLTKLCTQTPTDNYSVAVPVKFEASIPNYETWTTDAKLCVLPRRLTAGAPNGFISKYYDGSSEALPPTLGSIGNIYGTDNVEVKIAKAYYTKCDPTGCYEEYTAGSNRTINLVYEISGAKAGNYLPPADYRQGSMEIFKRPVTISGFTVYDKYYDGTELVDVDHSGVVLSSIAGSESTSGVVNGDILTLGKDAVEFSFITGSTGNAGEDISLHVDGMFLQEGTKGTGNIDTNYTLSFASLKGNIYPASAANKFCPLLSGKTRAECNRISKSDKDALLAADFALGTESKVVKELIKLNYDNWDVAKYGKKPEAMPTQLSAYYGKFNSFTSKLDTLLPNTFDILFDGNLDNSSTLSALWSWNRPTDDAEIGATISYADLIHSNRNYEILKEVPIPISIGKYLLRFSAIGVTRDYIPGKDTITLHLSPLNEADNIKITGWGTMENADAGTDKAVIKINYLDLSGDAAIIEKNYDIPDNLLDGLVGEVFATINKASYRSLIKDFPTTDISLVYDTLDLSARTTLKTGWSWGELEPGRDYFSEDGKPIAVPIVFYPQDTKNYNLFDTTIYITVTPRDRNNAQAIGSPMASQDRNTCGSDSLVLSVTAESKRASVWYDDGTSSMNYGTGSGNFKVTGVNFGWSEINYQIEAECYDNPLLKDYCKDANNNILARRATYKYDHYRYLPFNMIANWIRNKTLTITVDSTTAEDRMHFFKSLTEDGYKIDYGNTKWYKGDVLVGTGWSQVSSTDAEMADISLVLTATNGIETKEIYTCKYGGTEPDLKPVPIRTPPRITMMPSSFGARVVAGGSTLVLNTPNGGTISIYTAKGQLVSKSGVVDSRTIVKTPAAKGMYIVKFEAK